MTDLATIIALREAWVALNASALDAKDGYVTALVDALDADFPRHRKNIGLPLERLWHGLHGWSMTVCLGRDRDDEIAWEAVVEHGGLRHAVRHGPSPIAAVLAALNTISDALTRDALRAAVEATR